jgi:hypothetical protein
MMTLYLVFISPSSTNLRQQQQQQHNSVIFDIVLTGCDAARDSSDRQRCCK